MSEYTGDNIYYQELWRDDETPDFSMASESDAPYNISLDEDADPEVAEWEFERFVETEIDACEWPPGVERRYAVWLSDGAFVGIFRTSWEVTRSFSTKAEA